MMRPSAPPEVYAYFKVHADRQTGARQAVADFQDRLRARWPSCEARCLRRDDAPTGNAMQTLMEIYRWVPASDGSDTQADWLACVLAGPPALEPLLVGARHVERFSPCA